MTFSIRHPGLESPEIAWRRNLREESLKLGTRLHGPGAWRPSMEDMDRVAAGIIEPHVAAHFERVALYNALRAELPKTFRNGMTLAQAGPIAAITNFNTGTTYTKLVDAIYLASTGDEIILPAGVGANNGSFIHYSRWDQLQSNPPYTNGSNQMVIGNPAASSSSATYLSLVGIASSNNLSSVSWANTSGGQLTLGISGSLITSYRRSQYVRISGATNSGTGGAVPGKLLSINNAFTVLSVSGSTLVLNAPASTGVYGTIGGSPVLNNDRAQISGPYGFLSATLNPGDTTIQLDDASDFVPLSDNRVSVWGDGNSGAWQGVTMGITGVSGNNLTGVTGSSSLASPVPVGTQITGIMNGAKALFTPAATNPIGITMSNLELCGAASFNSGAAIFQWVALAGESIGSLTLNNMFFHDCPFGIRPGNSSDGTGVFIDLFNTELWRCGLPGDGFNHNMYVEGDRLTFYNSLSWFNLSGYTLKSRARVNYCMYSRTYSAQGSASNPGNARGSNFDFPNGGEIYLIGSMLESSLHDSVSLVRWGEEANYPASGIGGNTNRGAANPLANIYVVNSDGLGPSDGTGTFQTNVAPISVGFPGLKNPEMPFVTTAAAGALPARSYWFVTTLLDVDGNESLPSCMVGNDAFTLGITAQTAVGASHVAVVASPVARTGAISYNVYAAHGDPAIWWNSGNAIPPATGANRFFYDSGFTLPVCVVNAGGSQPAAFIYVAVVYVFSDGTESVNFAIGGADLRFPSGSPLQASAALISIPSSNLLTIKSPPAASGATGWYPLVYVTAWNAGGNYVLPQVPLSRQVFTPIAIGTDWVQSGAFIRAETQRYSFFKQTASPIALGTDWTEPTSGLANLNPSLLRWYRRGNDDSLGFSRWFAEATAGATGYVVNASNTSQDGAPIYPAQIEASILVLSGATSASYPFDADYPAPTLTTGATSTTATTAATNTAILASFRTGSTAGSGWTQIAALSFLMSEYKIVGAPQTGAAVTQTGGSATSILVDAIAGTSLAVRGTPQSATVTSNAVAFTIPTIVSGDVLVLDVAMSNTGIAQQSILLAIDAAAWGPPAQNQALAHSPVGSVINNAFAYYNPTGVGSIATGGYLQTFPGALLYGGVGYPTVSANNLQVNAYNGSGFDAPLVGAVWTNAPNFDFTLAGGSPLIGAGTNPGTGNSFSLVPTFQTSMIGTPTPGFPIAALTPRSDTGGTLGAIGSSATPAGLRLRFKFGWDWKVTALTVAAIKIGGNPILSRRELLSLRETAGRPRSGERDRPTDAHR